MEYITCVQNTDGRQHVASPRTARHQNRKLTGKLTVSIKNQKKVYTVIKSTTTVNLKSGKFETRHCRKM